MCLLETVDLKKDYGVEPNITHALNGLSFKVAKGEFVGIMGASGSGKTTLLNCISTIDIPTSGQIFLDGRDLLQIKDRDLARFRRENLGFIFQDFNLLDTLTVRENIALALVINKENSKKIDFKVQEIATRLGIQDVLGKFPYQVSGGQKQRCACARAIVNQPHLILADEPTGALDSSSSRTLMEAMQEMNESLRATILMVTHDAFSASYASRILFLKDGVIYGELERGSQTRSQFFGQILAILEELGGYSGCMPDSV
ncbi:MAG: ABC transporter ATP-binding protein [Firmicutes bacterium]|nr:ABC transporter ATP-binding protein [Bacillota bacterium]